MISNEKKILPNQKKISEVEDDPYSTNTESEGTENFESGETEKILNALQQWDQTTPDFSTDFMAEIEYYKSIAEPLRDKISSDHLKKAFDNVRAATMGDRGDFKRIDAYLNCLTNEESKTPLKNYPAIYLGSGYDIEYPLLLGARNIVMLDVCFIESNGQKTVIDKIEKIIDPQKVTVENGNIIFSFDFGNGPERVTASCKPVFLGDYDNHESFKRACFDIFGRDDFMELEIPEKISTIITYAFPPIGQKQNSLLKEKIVSGGRFDAAPRNLEQIAYKLPQEIKKGIANKIDTGEISSPENFINYLQKISDHNLIPVTLGKVWYIFETKK